MTTVRKMIFPVERALEDTAFAGGIDPLQVFTLLLPVWEVEVRATTIEGKDYELIDRFLERTLEETTLCRADELAGFLCLDPPLVDRALRFLDRIGHVVCRDGRFELTSLGRESLRAEKRYELRHDDSRKMYFDAFGSRPLPRAYYDPGVVPFLSHEDLASLERDSVPKPVAMASFGSFDLTALSRLAGRADRDEYNLPFRVEDPRAGDVRQVWLPTYLVRGIDEQNRLRYQAYSPASRQPEPAVSTVCTTTTEIREAVEAEAAQSRDRHRGRIDRWLESKGLGAPRPEQAANGTWRVALPPHAFGDGGALSRAKVCSFAVLSSGLLKLWCADEATRRTALLHRLDEFLASKDRSAELPDWLAGAGRQFELPSGVAQVRAWAEASGRDHLVARLDEVSGD